MNGIQGTCGMRYTKELDRFSLINRRNIQYANYTQALITEALRVGLLDAACVDDLQLQIMGQLETQIRRCPVLTSDEAHKARNQELLRGIFFTLDTYLLSFHDPMYALSALQSEAVSEMYTHGQKQLRAHYLETVSLLVHARHTIKAPLDAALRHVLDTEVHDALFTYDPLFCGRSCALFSYPTADQRIYEHRGIFFMKHYLRALLLENTFTTLFEDTQRAAVLYNPSRIHQNFFLQLLHSALGCIILGKFTGQLCLSLEEFSHLADRLARRSQREITQIVLLAAQTLQQDFHIRDERLNIYLRRCAKDWIPSLCSARGKETLRGHFTVLS